MTAHLDKYVYYSASELARAIRKQEITSEAITGYILDRIERYNPVLIAISTLAKDAALTQAIAADEAIQHGTVWGPLHGVPVTIKDTFRITGVATTAGVPDLKAYIPDTDAVVVQRIRNAGAVIIGHTNVPFMLADTQSYNEIFGTSKNPWDHALTPGGSTGGGAAALAAGLSYLSVGSDAAGSIRHPAVFCGVYGHKPSLGVVPSDGQIPPLPGHPLLPTDIAVVGPLARSAADLKLAMEVLGGPTPEDAIAYRWSLPPARGTRLHDYHLGYVIDNPICPVVPEIKTMMTNTIQSLKAAGVTLQEGWPKDLDLAEQLKAFLYLLYSSHAGKLRDEDETHFRTIAKQNDGSIDVIRAQAYTQPLKYYKQANEARIRSRKTWQTYFQTMDAFLLPAIFCLPFPHDHSEPKDHRVINTSMGPRPYTDKFFWIALQALSGHPATCAPLGLSPTGLPIGIQIIGPYLEDATPIDIAGKLADYTDGFLQPPQYSTTLPSP